ncbi:hypothetical protein QE380_000516 [Acinetobacter baylyi]|uniref:Uncharacterized protein n=1 Tax=Acinetobacter baylyi TaxID=202950 RepID=A0ABU0UTH4_ACIBI|nr:hypothetical protein [Acinetobacter baylyi]MDR6105331.1 hypothetical protein [Acinetobacter baylyi]MDR6184462.1 hypothetical protein [Acinetobacter baylyi]
MKYYFLCHSVEFPCLIIFYNFLIQFQSSLVGFVRYLNNLFDIRTKHDLVIVIPRYIIHVNMTIVCSSWNVVKYGR